MWTWPSSASMRAPARVAAKASRPRRRSVSRTTCARAGGRSVPAAQRQAADRNLTAASGGSVRSARRAIVRIPWPSISQASARARAGASSLAGSGPEAPIAMSRRRWRGPTPGWRSPGPRSRSRLDRPASRGSPPDANPVAVAAGILRGPRPDRRRRPLAGIRRRGSAGAHEPRLQDVVGGVAHQHHAGAGPPRSLRRTGGGAPDAAAAESPVAGFSPVQASASNARPSRVAVAEQVRGPRGALRLQAVVDGEAPGVRGPAASPRPGRATAGPGNRRRRKGRRPPAAGSRQ
jgi:hypothetical protein